MEIALITVGNELLTGETSNTNATWLAEQLTDRGATVKRILVLPDEQPTIADHVRTYSAAFDAVIVTGGIGGTPDDVTVDAVADAFDRELVVDDDALAFVERRLDAIRDRVPDLDVDAGAEATLPDGSRPIRNEIGLSPGCVIENVYVLPGVPGELKAMFEDIAPAFGGDRSSRTLYTVEPEANITPALTEAGRRFDATVGCYPDREAGHNRLTITATDEAELEAAADWLQDAIDASEDPVERDRGDD